MFCRPRVMILSAVLALTIFPVLRANPTFVPDSVFKGTSLTGWSVLGQAKWQAQNGELVGTAKEGGGWLVLDRSYQDVALHVYFRCSGNCKTGVLLRAEKTADGMKGVFVSIADGQLALFAVTLDAQGKELTRQPLRFASGWVRVMPPADPAAAARRGGGGPPRARGPAVTLPITAPDASFRPNDWNELEIILDAGIIRSYLNMGRETGGVAEDESGSFGPVALYAGGEGEVRFKEVAYKDLAIRVIPQEKVSPRFRVQALNNFYYSWTAQAGDFNRDGILDLAAGPYIYYGPDFTKSRELFTVTTLKPSTEFAYAQGGGTFDFNGDGWTDILNTSPGGTLLINPKGESRRWQRYQVVPNFQSEESILEDVDGDGRPELAVSANGAVGYYKYDPADPTKPWTFHAVSENGYGQAHGIGVGDVNGDGRKDLLSSYGWWEQPAQGGSQGTWTYHPEAFGWYSRGSFGGTQMYSYDVNGDGLNDVLAVMSAHGFGLAWFEQKRDAAGKISFVQHPIMGGEGYGAKAAGGVIFSQAHAITLGDVDGDGVTDFIVGKRYFTHLDSYLDPDPYGAPVVYWYRTVRNPKAPGGAEFVPELIHNRAGVGNDILAVDLNKDGALDIAVSTNTGTFIFWQRPRAAQAKPPAAARAK
ncbi:MAG: FG-GAP-like repeat-containing protein [Bryobacteraceae bacterium]